MYKIYIYKRIPNTVVIADEYSKQAFLAHDPNYNVNYSGVVHGRSFIYLGEAKYRKEIRATIETLSVLYPHYDLNHFFR